MFVCRILQQCLRVQKLSTIRGQKLHLFQSKSITFCSYGKPIPKNRSNVERGKIGRYLGGFTPKAKKNLLVCTITSPTSHWNHGFHHPGNSHLPPWWGYLMWSFPTGRGRTRSPDRRSLRETPARKHRFQPHRGTPPFNTSSSRCLRSSWTKKVAKNSTPSPLYLRCNFEPQSCLRLEKGLNVKLQFWMNPKLSTKKKLFLCIAVYLLKENVIISHGRSVFQATVRHASR